MPVDLNENERALAKLASMNSSSQPVASVAKPETLMSEPLASYAPVEPNSSAMPVAATPGAMVVQSDDWRAPMQVPVDKDVEAFRQAVLSQPHKPVESPFLRPASEPQSSNVQGPPAGMDFGQYVSQSLAAGKPVGRDYVPSNVVQPGAQTDATTATMPQLKRVAVSTSSRASSVPAYGQNGDASKLREEVLTAPTRIAEAQRLELMNQAEAGKELADAHEANRIRMESYDLARKENEDRRQAKIAETNAAIDQSQKEADQFQVQDGGFLSRNPGAILTAIGAIFGGALSARTGQPNYALNSLDTMINRDIQAQKDRLAQKNAKTTGFVNSLGRMRELFKDERSAEMAEEMSIRRQLNDKLEGIVQSSKSQQMRDQGEVLLREGRAKESQLRLGILERQAAADAARSAEEQRTQLEFTKMDVQHAYKMAEEGPAKFEKEQQKLRETYVPGVGFAPDTKSAGDLREMMSVQQRIRQDIPEIIAEYKRLGGLGRALNYNGATERLAQRVRSLMSDTKNSLTKAGQSMTEGERKMIGIDEEDVTKWMDLMDKTPAKFDEFKNVIDNKVRATIANANIENGTVTQAVNPFTNEPMPYYMKTGTVVQGIPRVQDIGTKETKK